VSYYHNERPSIFRYQESFQYQKSILLLYLEVSNKEVVEGLFYRWEGKSYFLSEFADYAKRVEGSQLGDVPIPTDEKSWSYPFFLYRQFILQITAAELPLSLVTGKDPYELICRCSGVYESDIRDYIKGQLKAENYDFNNVLKSLGEELLVAIGCTSCKSDVENIIGEYIKGGREITEAREQSPESISIKEQLPRWQSLDSQNLASESFNLLKGISSQLGVELKLLGTRPGSILIKASRQLSEEQLNTVDKSFEVSLGTGLDLQIK